MKTKQLIRAAVMQLTVVLILITPALAVTHTTTTTDTLTTGEWFPGTFTTNTAATVNVVLCGDAVGGGSCFQAVINQAYAFSYADRIELPEVGKMFGGALFDQTFHDTTSTHENWHKAYADALLGKTYGALETWSATYASNKMDSQAGALALGNSDLAAALTTASDRFTLELPKQLDNAYGHQNAVAVKEDIAGVLTWRSQNPDWGQAAVNYANTVAVVFALGPGNCALVPEPGTSWLFALGVMGLAVSQKRRQRKADV